MDCLRSVLCCIPSLPRADGRGAGPQIVTEGGDLVQAQAPHAVAELDPALRQGLQIDYGPLITGRLNRLIAQPSVDNFESLLNLVMNETVNLRFKLGLNGSDDPEYTCCNGDDPVGTASLASIIFSGVHPSVLDALRRDYDAGGHVVYDSLYTLIQMTSTTDIDHTILDYRTVHFGQSMDNTPLLNLIALANVLPPSEFNKIDDSLFTVIDNLKDGDSSKNMLSHIDKFPLGGHTAFGFLVRQGKHELAWECLKKGAPAIHPTRSNELIVSILGSLGTTDQGYDTELQFLTDFLVRFLIQLYDPYKMSVDAANIIIRDFWRHLDSDLFYDTSGNTSAGASKLNSYNPSDRVDGLKKMLKLRTLNTIKNWHCSAKYSGECRAYLDSLIDRHGQDKRISELDDSVQTAIAEHVFSVYKPPLEKADLGGGMSVFSNHYRPIRMGNDIDRKDQGARKKNFFKYLMNEENKEALDVIHELLTEILNKVEIDLALSSSDDCRV